MENKNIYEKLLEVKKSVEHIQKKKVGENLSYKAVSSSMVLGEINKELNKQGLLLKTQMLGKDIQRLERTKEYNGKSSIVYDFMATVDLEYTWINVANPSEKDVNFFSCSGLNTDPSKSFGSVLTYSEKYFMLKYFNVSTDESDVDTFKQSHEDEDEKRERKAKLETERLALERKKLDEAIALEEKKALEKAKVWNEFYEKMKETLSNKTFKSVSEYVEFIEITYLKKSPQLKENQGFKSIFEAFMPKAKVLENKASQVNKFDKCNQCKNETEFCICDIDKKVLAKV